jgi:hypothetical protein
MSECHDEEMKDKRRRENGNEIRGRDKVGSECSFVLIMMLILMSII